MEVEEAYKDIPIPNDDKKEENTHSDSVGSFKSYKELMKEIREYEKTKKKYRDMYGHLFDEEKVKNIQEMYGLKQYNSATEAKEKAVKGEYVILGNVIYEVFDVTYNVGVNRKMKTRDLRLISYDTFLKRMESSKKQPPIQSKRQPLIMQQCQLSNTRRNIPNDVFTSKTASTNINNNGNDNFFENIFEKTSKSRRQGFKKNKEESERISFKNEEIAFNIENFPIDKEEITFDASFFTQPVPETQNNENDLSVILEDNSMN